MSLYQGEPEDRVNVSSEPGAMSCSQRQSVWNVGANHLWIDACIMQCKVLAELDVRRHGACI